MNTKYWSEYKKWVEKENKPMSDFWMADIKKRNENYKKQEKEYEIALKKWEERKAKYDHQMRNRSFLQKLTGKEMLPHWYVFGRPHYPMIDWGWLYIPKATVTIEGYLDWCEKEGKL